MLAKANKLLDKALDRTNDNESVIAWEHLFSLVRGSRPGDLLIISRESDLAEQCRKMLDDNLRIQDRNIELNDRNIKLESENKDLHAMLDEHNASTRKKAKKAKKEAKLTCDMMSAAPESVVPLEPSTDLIVSPSLKSAVTAAGRRRTTLLPRSMQPRRRVSVRAWLSAKEASQLKATIGDDIKVSRYLRQLLYKCDLLTP